jgi:hypothetical protein
MASTLYRATAFVLYQLTLVAGIALLPVALCTRRLGVTLPIHRLVERLGEAYEASPST